MAGRRNIVIEQTLHLGGRDSLGIMFRVKRDIR
jgi:hypothetical protein